jgi:ribosomal protein S18 acetylase RimI-like enzyme
MTREPSPDSPANTASAEGTVIMAMTPGMVRQAARIHLDALSASRTAIMGAAYARRFIDWFCQTEHRAIALVAVDKYGDVVGYVIGAPLGYPTALSRAMAPLAAAALVARPWLFFRREFRNGLLDRVRLLLGRSVPRRAEPGLPTPTASLVAIGVTPAARGRKIGLCLVQAFEAQAQALGMRSLRLSMHSDNFIARRLYERCGWRPSSNCGEVMHYFRIFDKCS